MKTRGVAHSSGLILISLTAIGIVVWTTVAPGAEPVGGPRGGTDGSVPPQHSGADLRIQIVLASAGLDREALAAAGVSNSQIVSIETAASQWLSDPQHTLLQAQSEYRAIQKSAASALRSPASNSEARQAARASLANAKAALQAQVNAMFDHATAGLSASQIGELRHIQSLRWTGQPPAALATAPDARAVFEARDAATMSSPDR